MAERCLRSSLISLTSCIGCLEILQHSGQFDDFNHGDSIAFEDSGMVMFRFINGGMGSISYSTAVWDSNLESSITIIGPGEALKSAANI